MRSQLKHKTVDMIKNYNNSHLQNYSHTVVARGHFAPSYFYFCHRLYCLTNATIVVRLKVDLHNCSNPFETPTADFNARRTEIAWRQSVDLTQICEMRTFLSTKKE